MITESDASMQVYDAAARAALRREAMNVAPVED